MADMGGASAGISLRCTVRAPSLIPEYASDTAAGADLKADIEKPVGLEPGERVRIGTGVRLEIPEGYEGQIRPRSGLAHHYGITLLNSPGTIDADYRGEVSVILVNLSKERYEIQPGERIAQLVIAPVLRVAFERAVELGSTGRGEDGFGSTGR